MIRTKGKDAFIFIILFLYNNTANAEMANKLTILGNERISKETIKVYGNVELNKDLSKDDIDQILKNLSVKFPYLGILSR